ncbi:universal stress protein [Catalinimonas niigatensis]|uniref:universal stress protein n=1 Tax=Catalinimonas niigatensis TaxID=1397264 RepID=UPI00266634CF|nr:universal stress protein [Catalinimonas niigatensis]WPP50803.1 universal stress protein [Catalinimonas niigatensis]
MKSIKNILAPTDFSSAANNALLYATGLAREFEAKLYVLHSYRIPTVSDVAYPLGGIYPEGMVDIEDVREEVNAEMDKIKNDYLSSKSLHYETVLECGFAEENIQHIIEQKNIDLVVMGTRGANALQELFGSTTTHLINRTQVPILVIPENVKFSKIESIVLATDYQKVHKPETYATMISMANTFHANLDILHVRKEATKLSIEELEAGEDLDRILHKVPRAYHYTLEDESINEGIERFLKNHEFSMLAMVPREHSLIDKLIHGSKTQHMIFHTQRPLLVLKN